MAVGLWARLAVVGRSLFLGDYRNVGGRSPGFAHVNNGDCTTTVPEDSGRPIDDGGGPSRGLKDPLKGTGT